MMPAVTVFSKPKGDPIAATHSPVLARFESPMRTTGRLVASILTSATSVRRSTPSTLALNSRLSVSFTVTSVASATTWALVRMVPSALTIKPEPWPCEGCARSCGTGTPKRRKNSNAGSLGSTAALRLSETTLMLTTAGPSRSTRALKSGRPRELSKGGVAGAAASTGAAAWVFEMPELPL